MKSITFVVTMLVVFLVTVAWAQQPRDVWEYKVIVGRCNEERKLNDLGSQGWELATFSTWGLSSGSVETCVFKRRR